MLYEAPEVPGQEKEPIQRVTQAVLHYERGGRGTGAEIRAGAEQDGVHIVDHPGKDQQAVHSGCEAEIEGGG